MSTYTIQQISTNLNSLKELITKVDWGLYPSQKFGSESEYTYEGLLEGLQLIITDITSLVNNQEEFIKKTTYSERNVIREYLTYCINNINSPGNLFTYIDALKTTLRPLHLRYSRLRMVEFNKEIDALIKKGRDVEVLIEEVNKNKNEVEVGLANIKSYEKSSEEKLDLIDTRFQVLQKKQIEIETALNKATDISNNIELILNSISNKNQDISNIQVDAKANEKIIATFAKSVQQRESQLQQLEAFTNKYKSSLANFTNERSAYIDEAQNLIESAKQALNYKTAEGISAAFSMQYNEANNKRVLTAWVVGAIAFVIAALLLTAWIVSGKYIQDPNSISSIVGRVIAVGIAITGATFCAKQYVKQKNIIEDYAYKAVLSKSIIAFTEEIKKRDDAKVAEYLTKVLDEIHRDPLRSRSMPEDHAPGISDVVNKLVEKLDEKVSGR